MSNNLTAVVWSVLQLHTENRNWNNHPLRFHDRRRLLVYFLTGSSCVRSLSARSPPRSFSILCKQEISCGQEKPELAAGTIRWPSGRQNMELVVNWSIACLAHGAWQKEYMTTDKEVVVQTALVSHYPCMKLGMALWVHRYCNCLVLGATPSPTDFSLFYLDVFRHARFSMATDFNSGSSHFSPCKFKILQTNWSSCTPNVFSWWWSGSSYSRSPPLGSNWRFWPRSRSNQWDDCTSGRDPGWCMLPRSNKAAF